ncbi:MAG: hypothetical protein RL385_5283 [Pseudomonadota bacterium]|jgi:hypothetical protein
MVSRSLSTPASRLAMRATAALTWSLASVAPHAWLICASQTSQAHAQALPQEGAYQAGQAVHRVRVGTWGEDCGPRPESRTEAGGSARLRRLGKALQVTLPDRTIRTDACWTPNPAVRLASAKTSADGRTFRVECRTEPSDPKRENGVYALSVGVNGTLTLSDESSYDWQLKTSHCVASVSWSQTLTPGERGAGPGPQEPACRPGPLASLKLRPAEVRVVPGKRICFQLVGFDATGCALGAGLAAGALGAGSPDLMTHGRLSGMCFTANADATVTGTTVRVFAEANGHRADAVIRIAQPDLSGITAQSNSGDELAQTGGSGADDGVIDAGIRAVVAGTSGHPWLAALLVCAAAGLAVIGLKRRRPSVTASAATDRPPPRRKASVALSGAPPETLVCPRCRHGYPPGTERCPTDGERPIPYAEYRKRVEEQARTPAICGHCGAQLAAANAEFCGECGRPRT